MSSITRYKPRRGRLRWLIPALGVFVALAAGCAQTGPNGGPYPQYSEFEGREVAEVRFEGELVLPRDSMQAMTVTRPTRCQLLFLPICIPGTSIGMDRYFLDLDELARDAARLQLLHRDHGFYGTRATPLVDPVDDDERVAVRFRISPGRLVVLEELEIVGTEGVVEPEVLLGRIPLEEGEPFRRIDFIASADSIQAYLLREGHAYADVLRNFAIDTIANRATVLYDVEPGPLVRVDAIEIEGGERLGARAIRDQLMFREGDILRVQELNVSQRNLYELGFVAFATIEVAPEEMQRDDDLANATILVRVIEGPRYLVDASAGYGTLDCFRTNARWLDRNFQGGGRRLDIRGSLSNIGVGAPLGMGLEDSLCPALRDDPFSEEVNYRLAAEFEQPRIFRAGTRLAATIHTERFSEVNAYQRESTGVRTSLVHRLSRSDVVTGTAEVERVRTVTDPVFFCFLFEVCTPEAWLPLTAFRWSNALTLTGVRDRTVRTDLIERGHRIRLSASWADPILGSDDEYLRLLGEAVYYREIRPEWTLAGHLRAGTILQGEIGPVGGYIPPDRRFYAGGPNTVRGFPRNALGPQAYITTSTETGPEEENVPDLNPANILDMAVGGTELVVASVELRTPSPVLGENVRLGFFVDAGQVWARGPLGRNDPLRVTPGMGVRIGTPIGPIRLDAAYNAYDPSPGPLYMRVDEGRDIQLVDPAFRPGRGASAISRIQFHIAVGHAF